MRAFVFALWLAVLPTAVNAAAESTAMFPALRKRKQQLAAAQQHVEKQSEAVEPVEQNVGPVAPAVVPAPLDAGADGFPTLPSVSTMLNDASVSVKAVNSQASSLEARVVQAQMQSEAKMAKQKAAFDEKLKQQEQGNRQVIQANENITAEIKNLKSGNAALRKHSHEVEESNKAMRSELKTLQARLGVARDFTSKSLTSTDDSKSALLQVLRVNPRRHHANLVEVSSSASTKHDDDDASDDKDTTEDDASDDDKADDDDDSDDDKSGTSFLAVSSKVHREDGTASFEAAISELDAAVPAVSAIGVDAVAGAGATGASAISPGDLLAVLSKDVAHLAEQERDSEKNLKQLFIRDFRAGAKRHQALLAKQKALTGTRTTLLQLQAKLKSAEAHLESTNKQLEGRLHGLGQYLQKLAHFAMAPQKEVSHLMEVLPKAVTIKAEKTPVV